MRLHLSGFVLALAGCLGNGWIMALVRLSLKLLNGKTICVEKYYKMQG